MDNRRRINEIKYFVQKLLEKEESQIDYDNENCSESPNLKVVEKLNRVFSDISLSILEMDEIVPDYYSNHSNTPYSYDELIQKIIDAVHVTEEQAKAIFESCKNGNKVNLLGFDFEEIFENWKSIGYKLDLVQTF